MEKPLKKNLRELPTGHLRKILSHPKTTKQAIVQVGIELLQRKFQGIRQVKSK